ncbi:MAG: phosphoglucosamine mutase [Elusimicrobiota bacterium]
MAKIRTLKISVAGVRAVVGDTLTPQLITRFAQAFGTYKAGGKIVVGSDTRVSGDMVKYAVFSGLIAAGCEVVDLGICPVPTLQVMVRELNVDGGVMITASHNPVQWNALKFYNTDATLLNARQGEELLDIYHQGEFRKVTWHEYSKVMTDKRAIETHIKLVSEFVNTEAIRKRKFKIAIDPCNGAGAIATPKLLAHFGCEVVKINAEPTGIFARNPEPVPANLTGLGQLVKDTGAEFGLAQDADADRLAIVNEYGNPIGEEYTLALAVDYMLRRAPGTVAVNLSTSRAIDDLAKKYGVKCYRAKVGEINVVETMKRVNAVVGGEGNGGVIIPQINYGRDSIAGISVVLDYLASTGKKISELVAEMPQYQMYKTKIECSSDKIFSVMEKLKNEYRNADINLEDGLKINFEDYWVHVRASNTEPIIRIMGEATAMGKAESVCNEFREKIERL